ncbi:LCP family glycopolymer transferase [Enterococcus alishanensis]
MRNKGRRPSGKLKRTLILLVSILLVLVGLITATAAKVLYDVKGVTDEVYEPAKKTQPLDEVSLNQKKSFSVLLLGVDTGALGRTERGRSDTLMVATVNPNTKKTVIVSIPRDTYTEIVGHDTMDKVNHAYAFGGVDMAADTVAQLLAIPINYYVVINMKGIETLVDSVGGIEVNNPFAFTYEETEFPSGSQYLNGNKALKYVRMRYDDPEGDYGRQGRQREVIAGILKQMVSIKSLRNYHSILNSLGDNLQTDITFNDIELLFRNYREAFNQVDSEQAMGEGFMLDEISYQSIPLDELIRIQTLLKEQLAN